jgi:DNA-binding IscR family transcriptional regulator
LERLADECNVPLRTARRLLSKLVASGYLLITEGKGAYYPARDLEHIRISTLIRDFRHQGGEIPLGGPEQLGEMARELTLKLDKLTDEALEGLTLKSLVEKCEQ